MQLWLLNIKNTISKERTCAISHKINKMPGYVIHLAVGKIYEKNNKINNISSFRKGLIAPDMSDDSPKAHYGTSSSQPDLKRFLSENNDFDEYKEGYFLHLVTDYLFYNCFLKTWSPSIYEDYDKLNEVLIQQYGIEIPEEITHIVKTRSGEPEILDEDAIVAFINAVGKIDIRGMLQRGNIDFENEILMDCK